MEGLVTVKASDLQEIFNQLKELRSEVKALKDKEDQTTALSMEQVAKNLNLHYTSVRKLIIAGKLFAKYLNGDKGRCLIPLWSLKEYLSKNENSNQ